MAKSKSTKRLYINLKEVLLIGGLAASIVLLAFSIADRIITDTRNRNLLINPNAQIGLLSNGFIALADTGLTLHNEQTSPPRRASYTIPPAVFKTWFELHTRSYTGQQEYRPNQDEITQSLAGFAHDITQTPRNATFDFVGGQIIEKVPSRVGQALDTAATIANIISAINNRQSSVNLAIRTVEPELSLTSLQRQGITTLLGEGQSDFKGSPIARTHNINVGATLFNDNLIAPGEEFSFDKRLGTVDATTGYLPELVIKQDKILPEYGGGLCQVSTTMFRAALISGLPIVERHAHSLPVHYYNPQGYDAAIYPGVMDLRFKNDTGHAILIQSRIEHSKLYFDMYGASDGRRITVNPPRTYDAQPDGSLKAVLTRVITKADGTRDLASFYSNYKAPSSFTIIHNPLE